MYIEPVAQPPAGPVAQPPAGPVVQPPAGPVVQPPAGPVVQPPAGPVAQPPAPSTSSSYPKPPVAGSPLYSCDNIGDPKIKAQCDKCDTFPSNMSMKKNECKWKENLKWWFLQNE